MRDRRALFRRPASLALRVTTLVGIAMTVVFLVFNWISVRSLERHFAEMDQDELGVVSASVIRALGEVHSGADETALYHAVRGHHGVYYYVADAAGNTLYAAAGGPDLPRFVARNDPVDLAGKREMTIWREDGKFYRGTAVRVEGDAKGAAEPTSSPSR